MIQETQIKPLGEAEDAIVWLHTFPDNLQRKMWNQIVDGSFRWERWLGWTPSREFQNAYRRELGNVIFVSNRRAS